MLQDQSYLRSIHRYCEAHSTPPSELLRELERETNLKTLAPQMLSGSLQGQLLSWLSRWVRPKTILEVGTFTAYGTICLAAGLDQAGTLHTLEGNPELEYLIRKYLKRAGLEDRVRLHLGDALELIPQLEAEFDLVFLDANKQEYQQYFELVFPKMKKGALLLADNVLWGGKVVAGAYDEDTAAIRAFNDRLANDDRLETLMLPIRDGLLLARKTGE